MFGTIAGVLGSAALKFGADYLKGQSSNKLYGDAVRDNMGLQYAYAERYAKNSPSWNIQGLRDAGLNPILAVSNGVNLGANIPNASAASPNMDSGNALDFVGSLQKKRGLDIDTVNAESQRIQADSSATSAGASMLQAKAALLKAQSEAALNSARVRDIQVDTLQKEQGGGYRTGFISDFVRSGVKASESINKLHEMQDDLYKEVAQPYMQHSPSSRFVNPDLTPYDGRKELKRIPREDDEEKRKFDWRRSSNWLPPTIGF